jgi:hypothetical protein
MPALNAIFQIFNGLAPRDGQPKALPYTFDFTALATQTLELLLSETTGQFEFVQGIYVDNSLNANSVTFTFPITNQKLVVPANAQGCFPVIAPELSRIVATATIGMTVPVLLVNIPLPFTQWGPTTLNVTNVNPAQGTFTPRSTFIAATGVSQALVAINANRKLLLIEAPSANAASIFINPTGAASLNAGATPDSFEILPGGYWPPSNVNVITTQAVTVTGTINDKVIAMEM